MGNTCSSADGPAEGTSANRRTRRVEAIQKAMKEQEKPRNPVIRRKFNKLTKYSFPTEGEPWAVDDGISPGQSITSSKYEEEVHDIGDPMYESDAGHDAPRPAMARRGAHHRHHSSSHVALPMACVKDGAVQYWESTDECLSESGRSGAPSSLASPRRLSVSQFSPSALQSMTSVGTVGNVHVVVEVGTSH